MDRFDTLYGQGKMEHLMPTGEQNRILENIPFMEWENPYIDTSGREARGQEPKSIFSVRMNNEERFFENTSSLDADALCKAYGKCRLPFVEMGQYGRQIDIREFASIQQSDRLAFSVEFDAERDEITISDGENFESRGLRETVYPEQAEKNVKITLTVAKCGEFHNLGEYHEDIAGVEEAIEIFNQIPPERMNGIRIIGINIHYRQSESDRSHCGAD